MKNKLLVLCIILLVPLAVFTKNEEKEFENEQRDVIVNLIDKDTEVKLSLNDYLIGVVGCEMPASFNIEALKAQAIASRTFAYNYLKDNEINISSKAQCFIDDVQMKNKWLDEYNKYYNKIKSVVLSTNNLVIKYDNRIIKSYYYAMSNGKTSNAMPVFNEDLPYLSVVDSSFDENLNNFEVTTSFTYYNFCNLLNINPCSINISDIKRDDTNRVISLSINNKEYQGTNFRTMLSLRSTDFIIEKKEDEILITTKGYGHGVGMSQYGANYLANQGNTYEEIINYYYKNVSIENF
ncbi:MAG: stage II sporulation protein D [Bacilli bacterium]|nr:stage II sporulation protein D [Bacilli bacterium]